MNPLKSVILGNLQTVRDKLEAWAEYHERKYSSESGKQADRFSAVNYRNQIKTIDDTMKLIEENDL